EVAYGGLLQERRRALHARIVAALEALTGEGAPLNWRPSADAVAGNGLRPAPTQSRQRLTEQVERLAHHAVRGEVWDKALAYCRQAGKNPWRGQPTVRRQDTSSRRSALSCICRRRVTRASRPSISASPCAMRSFHSVTWGGSWWLCARLRPSLQLSMTLI